MGVSLPQPRALAPSRAELPNGAVVLVHEAFTSPAVTIRAVLRAGSVHDPFEQQGRAHFLSRVIDRGTLARTADAIADEFDACGVSLGIAVTRHTTTLTCDCLAEDFEAILALMADIIRHPSFPDDQFVTRRGEIVTLIRQDEDNPAVRANDELSRMLYQTNHPYGWPTKGTLESIGRIDRESVLALHRACFVPAALSMAIVGGVRAADAVQAAAREFGDWTGTDPEWPRLPEPIAMRRNLRVVPLMNKAQVDIAYGFPGIARRDPDYYAFVVMNNVFGEYGLGGRLGEQIRERHGLAYYASSALYANVGVGPLVIRAGVAPGDVDRALAIIDDEVARIAREGVSETELDDARRYLIGSIPRTLETNVRIARFLQTAEEFGLGLDLDRRLPDLYRRVTSEQVLAAARRVFDPDRAAICVAGPYPVRSDSVGGPREQAHALP